MKGGLAASIVAAEAFLAACPDFAGAVEISGTADEESGGYGGVAYLAEKGWFSPDRVQHVIIPEPLNKDRICLGHRGVWWAEIETHGRIAHGSMPFLGDSAIRHMGAVLEEMERSLFRCWRASDRDAGGARRRAAVDAQHQLDPWRRTRAGRGVYGLSFALRRRPLPDRHRPALPDRGGPCRGQGRGPRDAGAASKARRPKFSYEIRDLHEVVPTMTDRDAPVVRTVAAAIERVLARAPDYVVSPGTYDQKHIDRIGRLKNCIAYGPGILDLAHQPDEWVGIDDMADSAKVMAMTLAELLAGPEAAYGKRMDAVWLPYGRRRGAAISAVANRAPDRLTSRKTIRQGDVHAFAPRSPRPCRARGGLASAQTSITLGMQLEPPNLDPTAGAAAAIDEVVYANIFEGLTRYRPDGSIAPALAASWDISEDGTSSTPSTCARA
jgi:succinyl-diaminopimelate desuccinylase